MNTDRLLRKDESKNGCFSFNICPGKSCPLFSDYNPAFLSTIYLEDHNLLLINKLLKFIKIKLLNI